jgi:hypothetical protein
MESSRFTRLVIILLLLINFGTLGFLWFRHNPGGPPPSDMLRGQKPFEFLVHELSMNEQQKNSYDVLRQEHHRNMLALKEKDRNLHDELFKFLRTSAPDSSQVNSLIDQIGNNHRESERVNFYHFTKVRSLCNPDQQKRFDEVINEVLRSMGPQRPR